MSAVVVMLAVMLLLSSQGGASAIKTLTGINWMHAPKASSWMGDFLFLFACPHLIPEFEAADQEQFFYELVKDDAAKLSKCEVKIVNGRDGSFGWHDPYIPELTNGSTVALFRKPRNRLISAYLFGDRGMMIPPGHLHALNETYHLEIFSYIQSTPYPLITYANYLGIPSCQTKMVLGHYCGTEVKISDEDVLEAKRRVEHDFAFVGKRAYFTFVVRTYFPHDCILHSFQVSPRNLKHLLSSSTPCTEMAGRCRRQSLI